jgi:hypothetical protein
LKLKGALKRLFSREKTGEVEKLLTVSYLVHGPADQYEVQLILSNPSREDIDRALDAAGPTLEQLISALPVRDLMIQRLVFEYRDGEVRFSFAVRKDAVPVLWTKRDGV